MNGNYKPNFRLPNTKLCTVVYHEAGSLHEVLLDTPPNNDQLFNVMLKRKIGYGQLRTVKPVSSETIMPRQLAARR